MKQHREDGAAGIMIDETTGDFHGRTRRRAMD